MKIQSLVISFIFSLNFIFSFSYSQEIQETKIPIEQAKDIFVQDPWLQNASIGLCVMDLKTGVKVISHNDKIALPTASTAKLFATASAFEMLGPNYKPKTSIYFDDKIDENGLLKGNLWIRGGGDISLGSRYYNDPGHEDSFLEKCL